MNTKAKSTRHARHPSSLIRNWREDLMDTFRRAEPDHERRLHRGRPREEAVRNMLREFLPRRFGVDSGHVVSSRSSRSRDVDIILFDALGAPVFGTGSDGRGVIVPVESALGIVEVKSTLSPADLADARDQGRAFKSLAAASGAPGGEEGPFASAVFFRLPALASERQISTKKALLRKRLTEIRSDPPGERLDAALVLHADQAKQGGWFELGADGMFVDEASDSWFTNGPLSFSLFLNWLVNRLESVKPRRPDIGAYLFDEDLETDPADGDT